MKKTAIICEINPYHNGHRHIFECARAEFGGIVIAVMSGNFTQRGIPAVFDKYTRAGVLVTKTNDGGVSAADLVVELPFPWCSGGTEAFAVGGVSVALGMGADSLVCGSEYGDTDFIRNAAAARDSDDYITRLKTLEKSESARGEGSAVLNDRVMKELGFSLGANDKLAAEYVRNLKNHEDVAFRAFPRISGDGAVPCKSATELRDMIYSRKLSDVAPFVPASAYDTYSANADSVVDLVRYRELAHLFFRLFWNGEETAEGAGGLLERIRSAALESCSPDAFFDAVRTKKYTDARIRRAMLFAMLRVKAEMLKTAPRYTLLLAANEKGRAYLAERRKTGDFPIITKPSDFLRDLEEQYSCLRAADSLYTMCFGVPREHNHYIKKSPVICL